MESNGPLCTYLERVAHAHAHAHTHRIQFHSYASVHPSGHLHSIKKHTISTHTHTHTHTQSSSSWHWSPSASAHNGSTCCPTHIHILHTPGEIHKLQKYCVLLCMFNSTRALLVPGRWPTTQSTPIRSEGRAHTHTHTHTPVELKTSTYEHISLSC
jgi:hypothetical protein